jgi:hypothetical protein
VRRNITSALGVTASLGLAALVLTWIALSRAAPPPDKEAQKASAAIPAAAPRGGNRDLPAAQRAELENIEVVPLDAATALSRLKLLRIQMALDREEIAALELRLKKIQLLQQLQEALINEGGKTPPGARGKTLPAARARRVSVANEIIVKGISLNPVREALVYYRGRVVRLREGDKFAGLEVVSISERGLSFKSEAGAIGRLGVDSGVLPDLGAGVLPDVGATAPSDLGDTGP